MRRGGRTVVEGDDCVTLKSGQTNLSAATLLRTDELERRGFQLGRPDGVLLELEGARAGGLTFRTYEAAHEFLDWLVHQAATAKVPLTVGGFPLSLDDMSLRPSAVPSLGVQPYDFKCADPPAPEPKPEQTPEP